jgi:surfeit locus 1 family protein
MMRRVPPVATLLVLAAAAAMVWLGLWQLDRRAEKDALIARYAANAGRPPLPFSALWPIDAADLYRRATAICLDVTGWRTAAARDATGATGWRHIAQCRTGAEGPGIMVDMGVSALPDAPVWRGGPVGGRIVWAPDETPLAVRLSGRAPPPTPMIVSAAAAPGLRPTATPAPADLPNNHLAYAVQWFAFAIVALAIYAIALWRRGRAVAPGEPRR